MKKYQCLGHRGREAIEILRDFNHHTRYQPLKNCGRPNCGTQPYLTEASHFTFQQRKTLSVKTILHIPLVACIVRSTFLSILKPYTYSIDIIFPTARQKGRKHTSTSCEAVVYQSETHI